MADPLVTVGFLAFFGVLSGLLAITYVAFTRMDKDVRRARMFIMEHRIARFLGAFTVGFIVLTVAIVMPVAGVTLPSVAGSAVLVVWLGAMGYGTYELFLIVRPPKGTLARLRRAMSKARAAAGRDAPTTERTRSETDAAK